MGEYRKLDYTQVALPEELLTSFAKAMLPELRKFYASDRGQDLFCKVASEAPGICGTFDTGEWMTIIKIGEEDSV